MQKSYDYAWSASLSASNKCGDLDIYLKIHPIRTGRAFFEKKVRKTQLIRCGVFLLLVFFMPIWIWIDINKGLVN